MDLLRIIMLSPQLCSSGATKTQPWLVACLFDHHSPKVAYHLMLTLWHILIPNSHTSAALRSLLRRCFPHIYTFVAANPCFPTATIRML